MMLVEETPIPVAALPVDMFRSHLRLGTGFADDALQDAVLESFLRAAIAAVEGRTGKILIHRDFTWSLRAWRDGAAQDLPVAPVAALTSLALTDAAGAVTSVPLQSVDLAQDMHRPQIVPRGACLPSIPSKGDVKIGFAAGFAADFADIPADLAQAVLLLAAHYYENRNAVDMAPGSMPFGVAALTERYKTLRILGGGRP